MKHLVVVGIAGDEQALTREIQDLGVLHPEPVKPSEGAPSIQTSERVVRDLETVISGLTGRGKSEQSSGEAPPAETILERLEEERCADDQINALTRLKTEWEIWGNFNPRDVIALEAFDVFVQLWSGDKKSFSKIEPPESVWVEVVDQTKDLLFCTVSIGERIELEGVVELGLPPRSLTEIKTLISEAEAHLADAQRELETSGVYLAGFKARLAEAEKELAFQRTLVEGYSDEDLFGIQGWVPENETVRITKVLKESDQPLAVHFREPEEDETPPVLTRNGWLARTIEPLLRILGVPDYKGLDPALFFAPCMLLFFGICLSDAGYGAILFGVATWARKKYGAKSPMIIGPMLICQLFGIATFIWGLLTGGIFGIKFTNTDWVLIDVMTDPMTLFYISVACGVAHLTLAYTLAMVVGSDLQSRLENLGKIVVLWGAVLAVLAIKDVISIGGGVWQGTLGLGVALILFWSSSAKNPLIRVGLGLWNIYGLSGMLGDVMSYARLFGLGIATGAIASVVNDLAIDAGGAVPGVGFLITILIMLVGHGFNFAMGIIGAVVHPARLHAVEAFPKFVALTGTPYTPLR